MKRKKQKNLWKGVENGVKFCGKGIVWNTYSFGNIQEFPWKYCSFVGTSWLPFFSFFFFSLFFLLLSLIYTFWSWKFFFEEMVEKYSTPPVGTYWVDRVYNNLLLCIQTDFITRLYIFTVHLIRIRCLKILLCF